MGELDQNTASIIDGASTAASTAVNQTENSVRVVEHQETTTTPPAPPTPRDGLEDTTQSPRDDSLMFET